MGLIEYDEVTPGGYVRVVMCQDATNRLRYVMSKQFYCMSLHDAQMIERLEFLLAQYAQTHQDLVCQP